MTDSRENFWSKKQNVNFRCFTIVRNIVNNWRKYFVWVHSCAFIKRKLYADETAANLELCTELSRCLCYDSCLIAWLLHFHVSFNSYSSIPSYIRTCMQKCMRRCIHIQKHRLSIVTVGVNKCLRRLIVTFITVIY